MKRILTLTFALCAICTLSWGVPVDPRVLQQALNEGDTARYEQLLQHSRAVSSRMPKTSLREKALQHTAAAHEGQHRQFGVTPLMASRGLLILANFADKSFRSENTLAEMDSMMNGYHYTYNGATGSAAQYYSDQSLGQYRPHFDVVGPITLPKQMKYYGANAIGGEDYGDGGDVYLADFVLHCCSIASQLPGVDFANYDADNDGELDFVYIIYAGKGEADGGDANTIWPASWDLPSAILSGYSSLGTRVNASKYTFDGKKIGNFAYSGELNGYDGKRNGIGTPTHEFGHVLGLPDLYDPKYGSNYYNAKTPGDWCLMDGGSYNNNGKTPPCLSPWEKAFMGWLTPVNPGNNPANLKLYANGTEAYNVYELTNNGNYLGYNEAGTRYYIENRQKQGWDAYAPGHGMLIWKCNYNQSYWEANEPNASYSNDYGEPEVNKQGTVSYTVVSASGSTNNIGSDKDPFPGTKNVTSWTGLSGKSLTQIEEVNGIIRVRYMGGTCPEAIRLTADTTVCDTLLPITWRGQAFDAPMTYRDTLRDEWGCDSVLIAYTLDTILCEREELTPPTPTQLAVGHKAETAVKFVRNGQLYIRRGEDTFDLIGNKH